MMKHDPKQPIDISVDLWAYFTRRGNALELWTDHGCVGVLTRRDLLKLARMLPAKKK